MAFQRFTDEHDAAPRGRCTPTAGGPGGRHDHPGRFGGHPGPFAMREHPGRFGGGHGGRFGMRDHPDRPGGGPGDFGGGGPGWGGPPWGGRGPGGRGPGGRGPGGRGPGGRGGRGPRAARGDIRAGILVLLGEESMHGYQVMRELAERSGGVWRPSPGSIYPTLQQLQDEGLVSSEEQSGGRRMFSLTDDGRGELEKRAGEKAPWDAVSDDAPAPQKELRDLFFQVAAATRQVAEAGTDPQVAQAAKVLKDARRALYRILAEDEESEPGDTVDPT